MAAALGCKCCHWGIGRLGTQLLPSWGCLRDFTHRISIPMNFSNLLCIFSEISHESVKLGLWVYMEAGCKWLVELQAVKGGLRGGCSPSLWEDPKILRLKTSVPGIFLCLASAEIYCEVVKLGHCHSSGCGVWLLGFFFSGGYLVYFLPKSAQSLKLEDFVLVNFNDLTCIFSKINFINLWCWADWVYMAKAVCYGCGSWSFLYYERWGDAAYSHSEKNLNF